MQCNKPINRNEASTFQPNSIPADIFTDYFVFIITNARYILTFRRHCTYKTPFNCSPIQRVFAFVFFLQQVLIEHMTDVPFIRNCVHKRDFNQIKYGNPTSDLSIVWYSIDGIIYKIYENRFTNWK